MCCSCLELEVKGCMVSQANNQSRDDTNEFKIIVYLEKIRLCHFTHHCIFVLNLFFKSSRYFNLIL